MHPQAVAEGGVIIGGFGVVTMGAEGLFGVAAAEGILLGVICCRL